MQYGVAFSKGEHHILNSGENVKSNNYKWLNVMILIFYGFFSCKF